MSTVLLAFGTSAGCSDPPPDRPAATGHVEERTTDGNVTTVRTASGSKWSDVRLVEELSIGVDEGPDELMLGAVGSVWVDDEYVIVADPRLDVVRVFDRAGLFVRSVGRKGEGPGEFYSPGRVMRLSDGRIAVTEFRKILFYDSDGKHQSSWPWQGEGELLQREPLTLTGDDDVWVSVVRREDRSPETMWELSPYFAVRLGPAGATDEIIEFPSNDRSSTWITYWAYGTRRARTTVPLAPSVVRALTPGLSAIQGFPDTYTFRVDHRDGTTVLIERHWTPVPIDSGEADWAIQWLTRTLRRRDPDFTWPGVEMPTRRRAYFQFVAGRQGRLWVLSRGPGVRLPDCVDPLDDPEFRSPPCYTHEIRASLFDERDGTFYGELTVPKGLQTWTMFIDGDLVAGGHEDKSGVNRIKVYRLEYYEAR